MIRVVYRKSLDSTPVVKNLSDLPSTRVEQVSKLFQSSEGEGYGLQGAMLTPTLQVVSTESVLDGPVMFEGINDDETVDLTDQQIAAVMELMGFLNT